jgi:OFA family oxalate/formate antiporter-like MFS transporter
MAAGFGGGTPLFIPVISSLIADRGYQATFVATGIFQGLVILIVAQFLRHPPVQPQAAAPAAGAGTSQIGKRQFTTFEMLTTPQFYLMYAAFVLMATGGLLVTANAGPIARSWGFSAGVLTLAATLSPLANGASRVFWGWGSDRLGRETTMILTFVLQAFCLASVVTLGQLSGAWFAATLVAVYFTWGQVYSLFPSMSGDYFGTRHATSNYAVLYTAKGVASIIGPWVGARIFEQSGSWTMGFYGSAVMALIAAGIAVYLRAGSPSVRAKETRIPATA